MLQLICQYQCWVPVLGVGYNTGQYHKLESSFDKHLQTLNIVNLQQHEIC